MTHPVPRPVGVEVLANLLLGQVERAAALPPSTGGPAIAFERAVLPALQRTPCVVSFSGGRDSSAVLAVATAAARRHGLPDPVPVIKRYPAAPLSDERRWQELVLDHLGLRAEILTLGEELDMLGQTATSTLRRHGLHWPANAYMQLPVIELARGGALLTGIGGDELLGTTAARHVMLARGVGGKPRPRDLLGLGTSALPRSLRARQWRRRHSLAYPWLRPAAEARVQAVLARDEVAWPARWDASLRRWAASRAFAAVQGALPMLAADLDVHIVNPFLDPGVMAALLAEGGATGFPSRTEAMRRLFGELLPADLITRENKAGFGAVVWGPAVRAFARGWRGEGLDPGDVDAEALRREWLAPEPSFRTAILLQQAWLQASSASS